MPEGPFGGPRPFASRSAIGNRVDLRLHEVREGEQKVQLGVSGLGFPNRDKPNLNILFVLGKNVATLPRDVDGTLGAKIKERLPGATVGVKRSGRSSKAPFDQQAVIVTAGENQLPITDTDLHTVADVINREYSGFIKNMSPIQAVVLDTE